MWQMDYTVLARAAALLTAIPVHEAAHALASDLLGDPTARSAGRLSLNPLRHLDPFGCLCLLAVGIGWAKPVPVDPRNFSRPRLDMALTAAAGPVSNLLMAWLALIGAKLAGWLLPAGQGSYLFYLFLLNLCLINISLAVFNLLPIPPFDGSRILAALLPGRAGAWMYRNGRWILLAVLALLFFGVLDRPLQFLTQTVLGYMDLCTRWIDLLLG